METRHPVEVSFGSEFPAICNYCGVMAAWSRKTLKFCEKLRFFVKTTSYGKIFIILFRKFFIATPIEVVFRFREIWPTGNQQNRALFSGQKQTSPASQTVAKCGSRPKSVRASPKQCTQSALDFIQIGSLSQRVNTAKSHIRTVW